METQSLKRCPFCGSELNGEEGDNELLVEMNELKQKGILNQTMFVAVKIIQSMSDKNPVWLKEALVKQSDKINDSIQSRLKEEIRPLLKAIMEIKGSPLTIGRIQEETIPKRLKAVKPEDSFNTENSTRIGEDVTCLVKKDNEILGKIVIESKKVKKWSHSYIEQTKRYMEKENTEFGILATTAMPSDALSYTTIIDGVIVVQIDHIEPAYLFLREYLFLKNSLEREHATKMKQLEVRDQVLLELKQAISNGELDKIIETVNGLTESIDTKVNTAGNYIDTLFKGIKKSTEKIRNLMAKLISDHIEKMRLQLGTTLKQT